MNDPQQAVPPGNLDSPTRLRVLRKTGLLEQGIPQLDRLTNLCSRILSIPIVLVTLVDIDRQVFASSHGLSSPWSELGETPLTHSLCQYVVRHQKPLIIEDAKTHPEFRTNRAIDELKVVAFAGYPVVCQGQVLGSFSAIKSEPHSWSELELELLQEFAEAVSNRLELLIECDELKSTTRNLRDANKELEGIAEVLAHDLKAPIRGIRSSIYLVECMSEDISPDSKELLKDIDSSAERLMELIDTLSDFSNALHTSGEITEIDLDRLLDELEKDMVEELSETEAVITRAGVLGTTYGNRPLIYQLFQNLIANALKFQPTGQAPRLLVGQRDSDGAYYMQDNGIGIPEKSQRRIFELYRRGPNSDSYSGSGVGLAICARIVSKHNGRVWVESQPGEGSTFFVTLRMRQYDGEE